MTSGGRTRLQQVLVCAPGAPLPERSSPIFSSVPNLHSYPLHFSFEDVSLSKENSYLLSQFCLSHSFLSHLFILSPSFSIVPLSLLILFCLFYPLHTRPRSFTLLSFLPHLFRSSRFPRTRERGTSESSLTRNTPIPDSSIFCDGSVGSGSPCAPARRWVRSHTGIP